jgi:hypothetical protein
MLIRPAAQADVPAIARINVDSWRAAYRGIVTDTMLDSLSYAEHEERWHLRVQEAAESITLVAEQVDGLSALSGGKERTGDLSATPNSMRSIWTQRILKGIGTQLTRTLARALQTGLSLLACLGSIR